METDLGVKMVRDRNWSWTANGSVMETDLEVKIVSDGTGLWLIMISDGNWSFKWKW